MRCPGQDSRYWKPEAIYNVPCAKCGSLIVTRLRSDRVEQGAARSAGIKWSTPRWTSAARLTVSTPSSAWEICPPS